MEGQQKKGVVLKPSHFILLIILVLLLIGGGIFVGLNWNSWFGDKPVDTPVVDIDPGAADWSQSLPDQNGSGEAAKGIKIPGYPSITLPANQKDVQLVLLNPEGNPCYFTFALVLKDTDETIYTSKLVPPGKAVTDLTLTKGLPTGTYKATIKISTTSLEDQSPMNGANVETELVVK